MPFNRPALQDLIDRAVDDINARLPGVDARLRRSNLNVLARVHSGAVHGLYGYLDYLSRQIMPDTAETEFLDRWSTIWSVTRKAAAQATGNVTFTGTNGSVIPAGTTLQRSDGALYTTAADATIASGTATAVATAVDPGAAGNTAAASLFALSNPIGGVNGVVTVASGGLTQGVDAETDDELRARLIARIQQPPRGGAAADYVAWALQVAGVTRAWVSPLEGGAGTVTVRFVRDDDVGSIIPDSGEVAAVQTYIDGLRPVTAVVTVAAPTADALNFSMGVVPNTQAVKDAVTAELQDLLKREAAPGATLQLSHIREAISNAAGLTDYVMTAPTADVAHAAGHIAIFGTITWA